MFKERRRYSDLITVSVHSIHATVTRQSSTAHPVMQVVRGVGSTNIQDLQPRPDGNFLRGTYVATTSYSIEYKKCNSYIIERLIWPAFQGNRWELKQINQNMRFTIT